MSLRLPPGMRKKSLNPRTWRERSMRVMCNIGVVRRCAMCHSAQKLEIHHINLNEEDVSLTNLVYLCVRCHHEVHQQKNRRL